MLRNMQQWGLKVHIKGNSQFEFAGPQIHIWFFDIDLKILRLKNPQKSKHFFENVHQMIIFRDSKSTKVLRVVDRCARVPYRQIFN